jgi:hypothetical protein
VLRPDGQARRHGELGPHGALWDAATGEPRGEPLSTNRPRWPLPSARTATDCSQAPKMGQSKSGTRRAESAGDSMRHARSVYAH